MRTPKFTGTFQKDIKLAKKRGKDLKKLEKLIFLILQNKPLPPKYKTHPLKGNYVDHLDCHIEPDWLLIYRIEFDFVVFARTGTHADLFG
jgi:mRNA interferase YafQ